MSTTIRDVAEAAGVSPMAVSKVLHGRGDTVRVSVDKAAIIRRVAAEMNYQPNHLARSLRSKRTQTVGMIFEHFQRVGDQTGYFSQLLNGVMSATFTKDYSLTICPQLIRQSVGGFVFDGRFDGLLWCRPDISDETRAAINHATIPIVTVHVPPDHGLKVPSFVCDNALGLRLAVEHLAGLGHQAIAFATDCENTYSGEYRQRLLAFGQAMAEHGLDVGPKDFIVWAHDGSGIPGYWAGPQRHTAIICFSESHAVSLLKKCEELGIRVPEQLSIVGFDSTSFCDSVSPRLTSISQPVEQMAFDAAQLLLSSIESGERSSEVFVYPCGFDIRESTSIPDIKQRC
jgi:LacI family transcriptional regulator